MTELHADNLEGGAIENLRQRGKQTDPEIAESMRRDAKRRIRATILTKTDDVGWTGKTWLWVRRLFYGG